VPDSDELEVHLATCPECSGELARYREVLTAVGSLRDVLDEPPADLTARVMAHVHEHEALWPDRILGLARDRRVRVAAATVGGALVGAAAIGFIWWRATHRDPVRARVSA
jgi:anti-sigma factor RsiW